MSGKCRPCLRKKTLANLYAAWCRNNISTTDFNCVMTAFEKLEGYEKQEKEIKEC